MRTDTKQLKEALKVVGYKGVVRVHHDVKSSYTRAYLTSAQVAQLTALGWVVRVFSTRDDGLNAVTVTTPYNPYR